MFKNKNYFGLLLVVLPVVAAWVLADKEVVNNGVALAVTAFAVVIVGDALVQDAGIVI